MRLNATALRMCHAMSPECLGVGSPGLTAGPAAQRGSEGSRKSCQLVLRNAEPGDDKSADSSGGPGHEFWAVKELRGIGQFWVWREVRAAREPRLSTVTYFEENGLATQISLKT